MLSLTLCIVYACSYSVELIVCFFCLLKSSRYLFSWKFSLFLFSHMLTVFTYTSHYTSVVSTYYYIRWFPKMLFYIVSVSFSFDLSLLPTFKHTHHITHIPPFHIDFVEVISMRFPHISASSIISYSVVSNEFRSFCKGLFLQREKRFKSSSY
jgi:hypothetical protein